MWLIPANIVTLTLVASLLTSLYKRVDGYTLYVAVGNVVLRVDTDNITRPADAVVSASEPVVAVDLHQHWRQLFWATDYYIYRTPLDSPEDVTVVAATGRVARGGLVLDWVRGRLYWADRTRRRLETVKVDGRGRRVLYETELGNLGAVTIDPDVGQVLWIETGLYEHKIRSCTLFGNQVQTIHFSPDIQGNSPLTVDTVYKRLYFYHYDDGEGKLCEVKYGGTKPLIKIYSSEEYPVSSIVHVKDGFFLSNREGLFRGKWFKTQFTIIHDNMTADIVTSDPDFKLVHTELKNANQIRVVGQDIQPLWRDECTHHLCEQECVPTHNGLKKTTSCTCEIGFKLKRDKTTCHEEGYILYTTGNIIGQIGMNHNYMVLLNDSSAGIQTFDVHLKNKHIYWSDLFNRKIIRSKMYNPSRNEVLIPNVSAYGLAVDWLHGNLYWTDHNRVMVADLEGGTRVALQTNLDSPADITVDPINKSIFWAECGGSLSLFSAGLDGGHVTRITRHVTCGTSLAAEPESRTLYWLDGLSEVHSCGYDGSRPERLTKENDEDTQPWLMVARRLARPPSGQSIELNIVDSQPTAMKIIQSSNQPEDFDDACVNSACPGLCLLSSTGEPKCLCSNGKDMAVECSSSSVDKNPGTTSKRRYLEIVSVSSFSLTLKCAGPLLRGPHSPYLEVREVGSLVERDVNSRQNRTVHVTNRTMPFTIEGLNPATMYTVSVRNRVTRNSFTLTVHTPPPPLAVRRRPLVHVPGLTQTITWQQQSVHLSSPNAWEKLVHRQFFLLLVSKNVYNQSTSIEAEKSIIDLLHKIIPGSFTVLNYYKNEEEFDDDPEMNLVNIPWGEEFQLAMVQATRYRGSYHIDLLTTRPFALPDPHQPDWQGLLENILQNNMELERTD